MPPGRCAKIRLVALLSNTVVFELITLLLTIQTNHHCVQFIKTIFLLWRKANFCNGWAYSWRTGESANNCWVRDRDGETDSERERLRFWKFASYYTARSRSIFLDKAASFGRCLFDYRGKHSPRFVTISRRCISSNIAHQSVRSEVLSRWNLARNTRSFLWFRL